jgi:hypothetical protein
VKEWVPWVMESMVKAASPLVEIGEVKSGTPASRRVMEPVGVPTVVLAMCDVSVMGEPEVAVATRLLRVMTVGAGLMVRIAAGEAMV